MNIFREIVWADVINSNISRPNFKFWAKKGKLTINLFKLCHIYLLSNFPFLLWILLLTIAKWVKIWFILRLADLGQYSWAKLSTSIFSHTKITHNKLHFKKTDIKKKWIKIYASQVYAPYCNIADRYLWLWTATWK